MQLMNGFLNMPKREVIDCRATSLRDILRFYGIEMDSYFLLLMGNAFGFILSEYPIIKIPGLNVWTITNSLNAFEDNVLDNMELSHQDLIFSNDDNGWAGIIEYADRGVPLLVNFDARYIKADAPLKNSSELYLNLHHVSLGVLAGYDAKRGAVFLDIKPEDYSEGVATIERDRFMFARASQCYPAYTRNRCLELFIDENYKPWLKRNLQGIIKQTLTDTSEYMLNGTLKGKNRNRLDLEKQQVGIRAVRALENKLQSFRDDLADSTINSELADRLFVIVFSALRSGIYQGSNSLYREEFGKGLKKAAVLLKNPVLETLGNRFEATSYLMRDLVRKLSNVKYHVRSKVQYVDTLTKIFRTMAEQEEALFEQLLRVLKSNDA